MVHGERKSDTTVAIMYALNLWPALKLYCEDGRTEIDNSAAERVLRGVAPSADAINYLPAPIRAANGLPPCTRSSARPNSMVSILRLGCAMSSLISPITP